jgi:membrane-bound ClpP family serine protease
MKNKNNKTANELVNLILELREKQGHGNTAYAYATGALISMMDYARESSNKDALQDQINTAFAYTTDDLNKLEKLKKVCNEAKLEELYA